MSRIITLDEISQDAVDVIRASGEVSFQNLPVDEARISYLKTCAASAVPPEPLDNVQTLAFQVAQGTARLRLYQQACVSPGSIRPMVFYIHGGGWVLGSLDSHDGICRSLAKHTRATVVSVDYRLAPEHKFPVQLNDCLTALQFIRDNASALQLDLTNAVVAGDSAGGNLATVIANHPDYQVEGISFKAQVLFYPATDLTAACRSYERITEGFPLTAKTMRWFIEQYVPIGQALDDARLSPLLHAEDRTQPDLFILTVGLDPLADEGIAYAETAAKAGTTVTRPP